MSINNVQQRTGNPSDTSQEILSFISNFELGNGFCDNLRTYYKQKKKQIESNELFAPFIRNDLIQEISHQLEEDAAETKRKIQREQQLANNQVEDLIIRSDISVMEKIEAIYHNDNEPNLKQFYIISDLQSQKAETITLIPNSDFLSEVKNQKAIRARNTLINYPLGQALDPSYVMRTPCIKKIYSRVLPKVDYNLASYSNSSGNQNEQRGLNTQEIYSSFIKKSLFLLGGYSHFQDIKDSLFRLRRYEHKHPTLHYTWDRNPFKYFTFSISAY